MNNPININMSPSVQAAHSAQPVDNEKLTTCSRVAGAMRRTRSYWGAVRPITSVLNSNESLHIGSLFAKQQGQQQQQRWRCISSSWASGLSQQGQRQHRQRQQQHQQQHQYHHHQICRISTLSPPHTAGNTRVPARTPMARIGCAPPTAGAGSKYCGGTSALIGSGGASMVRSNTYGVFRELHAPSSADSSSPLEIARVPVECGVVSPMRTVPAHIPKTPYYADGEVPPPDNTVSATRRFAPRAASVRYGSS